MKPTEKPPIIWLNSLLFLITFETLAGFTEHDTFRSNQIREGQMSRENALNLIREENRPRYPNIKWYLDALGMDFEAVITTINSIPKVKVQQVK